MSYDLYFCSRSQTPAFSREAFDRYFSGRPHYSADETQAKYFNDDSGVYFSFYYNEPEEDSPAEEASQELTIPVAFNLNYFRPHVFGLEAEPELAAFVRHFDLTVIDVQMQGMGEGEYSREGFLRGWNAGNGFGYQSFSSQPRDTPVFSLPTARIESIWRWNLELGALQEKIGESNFVPRILCINSSGSVQTTVVWGDGLPILLPRVDVVLAARKHFAPRGWFRTKNDVVIIPWNEMEPLLRTYRKRTGNPDSYELFYQAPPSEIEQFFRQRPASSEKPSIVSFDQVLNRELLEQAKKTPPAK